MTSAEAEELITIPMEASLRGVPGIDVIRSSSGGAVSQVVMLFKQGTYPLVGRQRVQERLKSAIAELPQSSGMPIMLQPLSSTSRVMKIGLTSKTFDMMDLSMIAYWTIKFRLMSVPGVANVPMWGDRIKAVQVQVDPSLMRAHDVTLDEVMESTSEALDFGLLRYNAAAKTRVDGMLDTPNQRLVIYFESPVFGPEHLAEVPIALKNKRRVDVPRLGDIGKVTWDTWPLVGDAVINDGPGLMMIVEKLPWANTLDVTRGVEAVLADLRPGLPGVEIDSTIFRPATFIQLSIHNLTVAIIIGSILVIFILGAFLFEWRVALISVIAILASMVVALTATPALCLILLNRGAIERRESPLVPWLKRHYAAMLSRVLQAPRATSVTVLVLVVAAAAVWPLLGQGLLPAFKERDFLMHWVPAEGTSHPETVRITQAASRELRAIPGVRNFGAHVGRAVGGDEPYNVNFTENWISVDPKVDYDATRASVEAAVAGYPGLYRDVQTYLRERIKEVLTGAGESIVVRLFGPELSVLRAKAHDVEAALKDIPGLIDLHAEQLVEIPQIQVTVNLEAAARHGLKPGDVRRVAATLMSGIEVTDIHRDGKVYDVWVWSLPSIRGSVQDLREFLIDTPYGGRVTLGEVADVRLVPTPNKIRRENNSRRIDVHANVKGRDLGAVAEDVKARLDKVQFPVGYYPHLLGEYKERQAAQQNLLKFAVLVAIAIFLILHASFSNWRLATLVYLALPAALVGGALAAFAGDRIISLGSLVGIITVLGIAARNGILLIHHYSHLERVEGQPFGVELVLRGASERLSPILMTTLCTGLALLPLIVAGSIPGYEIEHPMAVVILGGLVTSTLLTLFFIPILYLRFGASGSRAAMEAA